MVAVLVLLPSLLLPWVSYSCLSLYFMYIPLDFSKTPCEWEWFFVFHRIKHANIRFVVHYKNRYKSVLVSKMEADSSALAFFGLRFHFQANTKPTHLLFDHEPQTVSFKIDFQCNYEQTNPSHWLSVVRFLIHEWSFQCELFKTATFQFHSLWLCENSLFRNFGSISLTLSS